MGKKSKEKETNGGNKITNYLERSSETKHNIKESASHSSKKNHSKEENHEDCHESSLEHDNLSSRTEIVPSDNEDIGDFHDKTEIEEERIPEVSLQMIFIGPCDTTYYAGQKRKFKALLESYNKDSAVKLILDNARFQGISNLRNLEKIKDDNFWTQTVPKLIETYLDDKKQKSISSILQMLRPKISQTVSLTKAEIYMLLLNMFFCTLPKQTNLKTNFKGLNFANLMTVEENEREEISNLKLEKLKCFINYLKIMSKRKYKDLINSSVMIQRSYNENTEQKEFRSIDFNLVNVNVQKGLVEEHDRFSIIVDFANKKIGGGVLNRGAVQEEILFCIYPELVACICLSFELNDEDSLVIYNAERFNMYKGYSDTFEFAGTYEPSEHINPPYQSVILAVDAHDFKNNEQNQYKPFLVDRELYKFLSGIQATSFEADDSMSICTGKWGCGAFSGDVYLKFLIQWVACSVASKEMIFLVQNDEEFKEMETMAKFLKRFESTLEIIDIINEYYDFISLQNRAHVTFETFLKRYCC